jgi:hypothetical protein
MSSDAAFDLVRLLSTAASPRAKLAALLPALRPHVAPWVREKGPGHVNRLSLLVWFDHMTNGPTIFAGCMTFHDTVKELFVNLLDEQLRDMSCTLSIFWLDCCCTNTHESLQSLSHN